MYRKEVIMLKDNFMWVRIINIYNNFSWNLIFWANQHNTNISCFTFYWRQIIFIFVDKIS